MARLQAALLAGAATEGAIATFTGYVRTTNDKRPVHSLELEHYPGMTQRSLKNIAREAATRWPLLAASIVHRVGVLSPGEQIVWIGVAAAHRGSGFAACEYIMDFLKTAAPLWKKEKGPAGERWVETRKEDGERTQRWQEIGGR